MESFLRDVQSIKEWAKKETASMPETYYPFLCGALVAQYEHLVAKYNQLKERSLR